MAWYVNSDADHRLVVSDAANDFVGIAAKAILEKLTVGNRQFRLMPYRNGGTDEFLGFDWGDDGGNSVSFTFSIGETHTLLPESIFVNSTDVLVEDATDALLLVRLIAERVTGNSSGRV